MERMKTAKDIEGRKKDIPSDGMLLWNPSLWWAGCSRVSPRSSVLSRVCWRQNLGEGREDANLQRSTPDLRAWRNGGRDIRLSPLVLPGEVIGSRREGVDELVLGD